MSREERFSVVKKLLLNHGWILHRIRGSHHIFKKSGECSIVIPVHGGKVSPIYAEPIKKKFGTGAKDQG